ncbi:MAG TPA: ribonuclease Z [Polyangia bacterium]|nr:ribonuclease Z [Polyangia bacterium]
MSLLRVTVLGTSAAQPTLRRGLSAVSVRAHRDHFLIDCGEGTQRQLLRFGAGFDLDFVLFTHSHADHVLGIIGFLRTMAMGGRTAPMTLYGPRPFVEERLPALVTLGGSELSFPVHYVALEDGQTVARDGYRVRAVAVEHRVPALGYVLEEPPRPGEFQLDRARALGIPEGPLYGQLQAGHPITLADGRQVQPDEVLGPSRRARKLAVSGDTRPSAAFAQAAGGADLLIHESTFAASELPRARETGHSTAAEAAAVAAQAGARELILTHLSARHDTAPEPLVAEARALFDGDVVAAEDGLTREIALPT